MSSFGNFKKMSREDFEKLKKDKEAIVKGYHDNIIDKNINRRDIVDNLDNTFFNSIMNMFEHNQHVNSLFIDLFENRSDIDFIKSSNIEFDKMNTCIRMTNGSGLAEYYTRWIYTNEEHKDSKMNNFFLVVDDVIQYDCAIEYFLVTNNNDIYPIHPNNKSPLLIIGEDKIPTAIKIKAVIKRHKFSNNIPFIKGISLMYEDEYTKSQLDIFNPNFSLNCDTGEDVLTLFRDNTNNDVLYKTENNQDKTELIYDDNDTLMYIDVYDINTGQRKSRTEMIYEDYLNSSGRVEKVLGKIRTIKSKENK